MTGYTSGKTTHDPEPYVDQWGIDRNSDGDWAGYDFDARFRYAPRPEFDHHNPILAELRRTVDLGSSLPAMVQVFRNWFRFGKAEKIPATLAQADHAWRVLTRLAALTTTTNGVTD